MTRLDILWQVEVQKVQTVTHGFHQCGLRIRQSSSAIRHLTRGC